METLTQADIMKIINDSEILILPENSTVEEVLLKENEILNANNNYRAITVVNLLPDDTEQDFEIIYQYSKTKRQNLVVSSI